MHELAVTEEIIKVVTDASKGRRIREIVLVIGNLSSFIDESIQFYFDKLTESTPLEGLSFHLKGFQ